MKAYRNAAIWIVALVGLVVIGAMFEGMAVLVGVGGVGILAVGALTIAALVEDAKSADRQREGVNA